MRTIGHSGTDEPPRKATGATTFSSLSDITTMSKLTEVYANGSARRYISRYTYYFVSLPWRRRLLGTMLESLLIILFQAGDEEQRLRIQRIFGFDRDRNRSRSLSRGHRVSRYLVSHDGQNKRRNLKRRGHSAVGSRPRFPSDPPTIVASGRFSRYSHSKSFT